MKRVIPTNIRILVVEDHADPGQGIARTLMEAGYVVEAAASGEAALRAVQERRPDLILLDRNLPGTDGGEICRRFKSDRAPAELLVIVLTAGGAENEDQAEELEPGTDGYITRSITRRELLARIDAYVRTVALARSLRWQTEELKKTSEAATRSAQASLNLFEDAVEAQRRLETINQKLEQEIREREQAEAELERTNRALRVANGGSDALLHATDEDKLLSEICRIAVEAGGYRMAWIGFAENDAGRTVRPMAVADVETCHLVMAQCSWGEGENGCCPAGVAIRTGQTCVCQDLQADPRGAHWQAIARERGYASALAIPLRDRGRVFGSFTIFAGQLDAFRPPEVKLLSELGEELSYGIGALRARREREDAEAALRASEERYRILFEGNPLPMWLYDVETRGFLAVNDTAVRNYGYSREEFQGMKVDGIQLEDDLSGALKSSGYRGAKGAGFEEYRHRRKDGSVIHVEVAARALTFNGRSAQLVLATDITEKKLLEEKFLRAQRLESLGMLAAGIAHDLNNVLAPIIFAAPMLRDSLSTPRDLKILETLEHSAERGAGLVKQILGFVRTASGELRPVQVKHLLRDLINVIEETFPKSIQFEHHVPSSLWPVMGNATQIHQVVLNLCVNARDAMPNGGTLRLVATNRELDGAEAAAVPGATPGPWLVVEVTDTGTGILPEVLQHIWTPFFTTKGADHGTGLGLATVRSIVNGHNGCIELRTAPGQGTTFRIFLPAIDSSPPKAGTAASLAPHGHGELIVVVDDDAAIRELVSVILERHNYRVLTCADGVEAIVAFTKRATEISALVTDLDMPHLGGVELAQTLAPLYPQLKVVAMSGLSKNPEQPGAKLAIRELADAYLNKPFPAEELLTTLDRLLQPREKT